jgi:threonine dehydratase
MKFLRSMNPSWNISLFHYRNHGADYGRVLVACRCQSAEMRQFRRFLARSAIPGADETRNPAYRLFLG